MTRNFEHFYIPINLLLLNTFKLMHYCTMLDHKDCDMSYNSFIDLSLLLIFLSFIVERSLAVFFETQAYISIRNKPEYIKPLLAVMFSLLFLYVTNIEPMKLMPENIIVKTDSPQVLAIKNMISTFLFALVISGGSKASLKLFKDVLQVRSGAEKRRDALDSVKANERLSLSNAAANENPNALETLDKMMESFENQKIAIK